MSNSMTTEEAVMANHYKEQSDALNRLMEDKDFKKVIIEGYFKDEAIRLTGLLAHDEIRRQNRSRAGRCAEKGGNRPCYWLCRLLHIVDKNHCEKSIGV